MLRKEAILQEMLNLIKKLQSNELFNDYIRILINDIKVEMVHYEEKTLNDFKEEEGVKFYGIDEIAVMKLEAMLKRTEPRDYIDFAYILKEKSLDNIFENYKKVFGAISPLYVKRTLLTKSKSIKDNEWLAGGIKMLKNDIDIKEIPAFIENAIEQYNNKSVLIQNKIKDNIKELKYDWVENNNFVDLVGKKVKIDFLEEYEKEENNSDLVGCIKSKYKNNNNRDIYVLERTKFSTQDNYSTDIWHFSDNFTKEQADKFIKDWDNRKLEQNNNENNIRLR